VKIGRYEVVGEVARGGMGVVLRARDDLLRREVAIKVLLAGVTANELQRKRFEREVNALARLRHPNIVLVHEAGQAREGPYVVMDFIDGESLESRLARAGPLPLREALRLMEAIAGAIDHAHTQGILHRDLKPANIIVDRAGVPHVTDFGLARDVDPRESLAALSRSGVSIGTPGFWPPEQAYGLKAKIGPASDVYGLGATLYALLTGDPPYDAPSLVEVLGLMTMPVKPPSQLRPEVSPALDAVVLRAMAHEPEDRYPSAAAFAEALADARRRAVPADAGRRRGVMVAAGALAALALGGVAVGVTRGLEREEDAVAVVTTSAAPSPSEPEPEPEPATEVAPAPVDPAADAFEAAKAALAAGRPIEARTLVERAHHARPDHVDALVLRAQLRAAAGDLAGAEQDLSVALALALHRTELRLERARVRKELEDATGVAEDATAALDATDDAGVRHDALALRAWARAHLDDTQRAIQDWTDAIAIHPTAEALCEVGVLEFGLDHFDIAFDDFDLALQLDPDHELSLLNRAAIYTKRGDHAAALADLDRAVKVRPDLAVVWSRRGDARRLLDDHEGALADLGRAIDLDPGPAEPWRVRGQVQVALGNDRAAVEDFRQALARDPGLGRARSKLGLALYRLGDPAAALAELDEALRRGPEEAILHFDRALVREETGDLAGARADYDRAIELDPDDWQLYYNRGMLRGSDDYPGALADYDRAEALGCDGAELFLNRGDLRRRMNDLAGAVVDLERALTLDPTFVKVHLSLGLALFARKAEGDLPRAEAELTLYLEATPETDPQWPRILAERGLVRKARGDVDGAAADFKRVTELCPPADPLHRFSLARLKELGRAP
jgi:tetratricopeptide (TPR) repeat protein